MTPTRSLRILAACLLALAATACSATYAEDDPSRILSVSTPGVMLHSGQTVALMAGSGIDVDSADARSVSDMLETALWTELARRGLRRVGEGAANDLWFGWLAAETAALDPREIVERFGIYEAGDEWSEHLPTGTVLVLLVDGRTRAPLWRASTQLEIRDQLPEDERRARIERHVSQLFASCPTPR